MEVARARRKRVVDVESLESSMARRWSILIISKGKNDTELERCFGALVRQAAVTVRQY